MTHEEKLEYLTRLEAQMMEASLKSLPRVASLAAHHMPTLSKWIRELVAQNIQLKADLDEAIQLVKDYIKKHDHGGENLELDQIKLTKNMIN